MTATEPTKTQTAAEVIEDARREDKDQRVFVLYCAGIGSNVVAAGRSALEMWANAEKLLGETKQDLRKKSHVFDVMTAREASRLVG